VPALTRSTAPRRWELYRLLGEPARLRLLALAATEELAIGELSELLGDSQPKVSRHAKALREAGLLVHRKEGTRAFVHLDEARALDPVVADALEAGRRLCTEDGSLGRVAEVVAARDAASRAFFERPSTADLRFPEELAAYLSALAPLLPRRDLAVDAGTGDGNLLEVLAPIYQRVVAFDRSGAQLERAKARVAARGYDHVELHAGELDDEALHRRVETLGGADAVFASRVLHHAPRPTAAVEALARMLRPGGVLLLIDYAAHGDETMRDAQADLWLGFDPRELEAWAARSGLVDPTLSPIPSRRCGSGPDGHLDWLAFAARRPL
jgi:SAM-dependent methyltransferase/DNA-binding transcriptional ArsR family regulator